jgi:hypothetical protein
MKKARTKRREGGQALLFIMLHDRWIIGHLAFSRRSRCASKRLYGVPVNPPGKRDKSYKKPS